MAGQVDRDPAWFLPHLDRVSAEGIVQKALQDLVALGGRGAGPLDVSGKSAASGVFLVRASSQPGAFALTKQNGHTLELDHFMLLGEAKAANMITWHIDKSETPDTREYPSLGQLIRETPDLFGFCAVGTVDAFKARVFSVAPSPAPGLGHQNSTPVQRGGLGAVMQQRPPLRGAVTHLSSDGGYGVLPEEMEAMSLASEAKKAAPKFAPSNLAGRAAPAYNAPKAPVVPSRYGFNPKSPAGFSPKPPAAPSVPKGGQYATPMKTPSIYNQISALFSLCTDDGLYWSDLENAFSSAVYVPANAAVLFDVQTTPSTSTLVGSASWKVLVDWLSCFKDPENVFAFLCSFCNESWFFGSLNSNDSVDRLRGVPAGSWLLRISSQPGSMVITVKSPLGAVDHKRVNLAEVGGGLLSLHIPDAPEKPTFTDPGAIRQMIQYGQTKPLFLGKETLLSHPADRFAAPAAAGGDSLYSFTPETASGGYAASPHANDTYVDQRVLGVGARPAGPVVGGESKYVATAHILAQAQFGLPASQMPPRTLDHSISVPAAGFVGYSSQAPAPPIDPKRYSHTPGQVSSAGSESPNGYDGYDTGYIQTPRGVGSNSTPHSGSDTPDGSGFGVRNSGSDFPEMNVKLFCQVDEKNLLINTMVSHTMLVSTLRTSFTSKAGLGDDPQWQLWVGCIPMKATNPLSEYRLATNDVVQLRRGAPCVPSAADLEEWRIGHRPHNVTADMKKLFTQSGLSPKDVNDKKLRPMILNMLTSIMRHGELHNPMVPNYGTPTYAVHDEKLLKNPKKRAALGVNSWELERYLSPEDHQRLLGCTPEEFNVLVFSEQWNRKRRAELHI